jgi:hypothetical protein
VFLVLKHSRPDRTRYDRTEVLDNAADRSSDRTEALANAAKFTMPKLGVSSPDAAPTALNLLSLNDNLFAVDSLTQ